MNNVEETNRKKSNIEKKKRGWKVKGTLEKKMVKGSCLNDKKKSSFPQRSINTWNGLKEEMILTKNVHQLKEKLDKYGNRNVAKGLYITTSKHTHATPPHIPTPPPHTRTRTNTHTHTHTQRRLRNIWMAFHFLDKEKMRKSITTMIRLKREYPEVIWSPQKKKACVEIRKNTENCS